MTLDCGNPYDACGFAVERIKSLGIQGSVIVDDPDFTRCLLAGEILIINSSCNAYRFYTPSSPCHQALTEAINL